MKARSKGRGAWVQRDREEAIRELKTYLTWVCELMMARRVT